MIFDNIKYQGWSKRNIFVAALVPIAVVAFYNWFVTPHLQYLQAAQGYEKVAGRVEETCKSINTKLLRGQKELDSVSGQFRQERQKFFEVGDTRKFLESIQSSAEKNRCLVDTLKFLPPRQVAVNNGASVDMQQYQANLAVSGKYQNIIKLLDSLQSGKQKVWIDTLNLRHKAQMSDILICDLSLSIYTLKVKEIVSDVKTEK